MDLNQLAQALSASLNPTQQKAAEAALNSAESSNFPEYLRALATILCDPSRPPEATRVAGIILKNAFFDSRSDAAKNRKYARWNQLVPDQTKQYIRECVLRALVSPVGDARKSAAQVVSALGVLELGEKRWPEMIPALYANAMSPQLGDDVKINTLEAMGYLCESVSPSLVTETLTNNLLTAIVENVKVGKADGVRKAAIEALFNTLEFAEANMKRTDERDYIVMNICECARATNAEVKCVAFDCMVRLAELYYEVLSTQYMEAFYHLTTAAVQAAGTQANEDNENVALHAIEFWATLCDTEIALHEQEQDGEVDPTHQCKHFVKSAMPSLVQLITTVCLTKQAEELTDDEEWDLAKAGAALLGLISRCQPKEILGVIMPFVQANLPLMGVANWRHREAGLMAFGKCLEGPESSQLTPWIREGIEFFLSLLDPAKETVPQVRDTAAWVIGTVCELHIETIVDFLPRVLHALLQGLSDRVAIVAAKHALAIKALAEQYRDEADKQSNILSPHLVTLLPKLIETTQRADWEQGELRGECFEAINAVVESCAIDGLPIVGSLLDEVIRRLTIALSARVESSAQKDEVHGMIQYCCGTLLVITQKVKLGIKNQADTIMNLMLQILANMHNGIALMDAHLVIGAMADALGPGFKVYYKAVLPHVLRALDNREEYQTCQTATELISDFSRAVGDMIAEDSHQIMQLLLRNLADPDLDKSVKPPTISAFGDIAFALNEKYEYYAEAVLAVLDMASQMTVDKDDYDMVDYLNEIREAILETYTALLQSLGPQKSQQFFAKRVDTILTFLATISCEAQLDDGQVSSVVIKNAVGVLGDLCKTLGNDVKYKVRSAQHVFQPIIQTCVESDDSDMNDVGNFCIRQLH